MPHQLKVLRQQDVSVKQHRTLKNTTLVVWNVFSPTRLDWVEDYIYWKVFTVIKLFRSLNHELVVGIALQLILHAYFRICEQPGKALLSPLAYKILYETCRKHFSDLCICSPWFRLKIPTYTSEKNNSQAT